MWPIFLFVLLFIICRIFPSSLTLFLSRSVQMLSIFLQCHISKFLGVSDLFSEMSTFHHHTKLCSKCRTLLVTSLNLSPIFWRKILLFVERSFGHGNPEFNFMGTSCIICLACYPNSWNVLHSPVVFDIPHSVLEMAAVRFPFATLLSYIFISITQNVPISVSLSNMSCSTVSFLDISTSLSHITLCQLLVLLIWSLQTLNSILCMVFAV